MTQLLEKAFEKASELPDEAQDDFAAFILEELQSERRWKDAFDESQDELERLADEAIDEYKAGNTQELDPGQL
jgi:hypothetical protein